MGALVHISNPFEPLKASVHRLDGPVTVRRLVQRHKALRAHTMVYRPGGIYGRRKVREFRRRTVCVFNDRELTRSEWKRTTVGPKDVVVFHTPLQGGGGLRLIAGLVLAIAIAVAAPYLGPLAAGAVLGTAVAAGSTAAIVGTAVVGIALSAVAAGVMSLFAPPAPPTTGAGYAGGTPTSSPVYNLTAQGNYARLNSPIPEAFGRNRMFPDFVSAPYANYDSSNDQYLHYILGLGIGEFEIDEDSIKLGDTPITSYEDIEYQIMEPGDLADTSIADERWITATDVADVELEDSAAGSPYAGPFAVVPAGVEIDRIEIDTSAPRGIWAFDAVVYLLTQNITFEVEARLIDDAGAPLGSWETFTPITKTDNTQEALRFTDAITLPSTGRWEVRMRRTDLKNVAVQAGHEIHWAGLRGRIIGRRTFPDMTCIAVKMKAGADLNAAQSRRLNLVATRKLETWDSGAGAMGTVKAATRSPCDAFAYIARTSNGGRLSDDQIELETLYDQDADFTTNNWTFDFVFDSGVTVSEALARVSRAVIAERVTQGGKLHLVRDVEAVAPVAMFSPRNITPGSDSQQYLMRDSTSSDALIGTYIDQTTWKPVDVTVAFDDSPQERPTRLTLHGVGNREQAREVLWHMAREDRYRRKIYGWTAPMEGLAVTFGDGISYSMDIPNYGQTLEVIDVDQTDPNAPIFTFADEPDFGDGTATYYAAVRDSKGHLAGPWVATAVSGQPNQLELTVPTPADLPEILTGGDKERTWMQLGPGEAYAKPLKVKQVTPRDESTAEIIAFDDDPRMYEAIPEEPEVPIGVDTTEPLTVVVTTSGTLRTKANAAGYSGLAAQQVTFTVAAGVDVWLKRGSWPSGAEPILQLAGTLTGTDGAGGAGGGSDTAGSAGGTGGTALSSSTGALTVTGAGTIRGGKGGGGGGGGGGGSYYETTEASGDGGTVTVGHSVTGGAGGAGNGGTGSAGTTDGTATGGTGGNGGALASSYGTAGSAGSAGAAGTGGTVNGAGGAGGLGGAGGKAIVGVANVDLTGFTGLIVGATS